MKKKDMMGAIDFWQRAAEQGHAQAKIRLDHVYDSGKYSRKDIPVALKLYRKAQAEGNAEIQFRLGQIYHQGKAM